MVTNNELNSISNDLYLLVFYIHGKIFNPTEMLKGMPIPPSNMKVIFHLVRSGPCPVSKVANELQISKPNMTPIIDNLIAEGFVNRYENQDDRRQIMVEATNQAYEFLSKQEKKMKATLSEKIAVLEDNDLEMLKKLLPQLMDIIMKIN